MDCGVGIVFVVVPALAVGTASHELTCCLQEDDYKCVCEHWKRRTNAWVFVRKRVQAQLSCENAEHALSPLSACADFQHMVQPSVAQRTKIKCFPPCLHRRDVVKPAHFNQMFFGWARSYGKSGGEDVLMMMKTHSLCWLLLRKCVKSSYFWAGFGFMLFGLGDRFTAGRRSTCAKRSAKSRSQCTTATRIGSHRL